jgi:RNA polymerase sigma-70 factor (ECF subfamily)
MSPAVQSALAIAPPIEMSEGNPRTERQLVRAARRGDTEAVESLVRAQWPRAHRAAFLIVQDRAAAEDIAQESIVAAIRALDRFDWRRPISPWIHRIVVNRSVDWLRARRARPELPLSEQVQEGPTPQPTEMVGDVIVTTIATLDPEDRAIVVLSHVLDFRSNEIGDLLGMNGSTVRNRLSSARQQILSALDAEART